MMEASVVTEEIFKHRICNRTFNRLDKLQVGTVPVQSEVCCSITCQLITVAGTLETARCPVGCTHRVQSEYGLYKSCVHTLQ